MPSGSGEQLKDPWRKACAGRMAEASSDSGISEDGNTRRIRSHSTFTASHIPYRWAYSWVLCASQISELSSRSSSSSHWTNVQIPSSRVTFEDLQAKPGSRIQRRAAVIECQAGRTPELHRGAIGVQVSVGQASGVPKPDRDFTLAPAQRELAAGGGTAGSQPDRVAGPRLGTKDHLDSIGLDPFRLMAAPHELKRSEPVAGFTRRAPAPPWVTKRPPAQRSAPG